MRQTKDETIHSLGVPGPDSRGFCLADALIKAMSVTDGRREPVALWREAIVKAGFTAIGMHREARNPVFDLEHPALTTHVSVVLFCEILEDL